MPERLTSTQSLATVGLENLSPRHFEVLQQAFWTILSTDLATETFAQVVDGRPTRDVYRDYFNEFRKSFQNNIHPSNAALEAVESCRRNLNLGNTQISAKVVYSWPQTLYLGGQILKVSSLRKHSKTLTLDQENSTCA